jgi:hypothetical protein
VSPESVGELSLGPADQSSELGLGEAELVSPPFDLEGYRRRYVAASELLEPGNWPA